MPQHTKVIPTTPRLLISKRTPASFKVCPLCGTLNVKENEQCCCCDWAGQFDSDSHQVQVKMWQMVHRSPELQMLLLKELRSPWHKRFMPWLRSFFNRRRLDIRA